MAVTLDNAAHAGAPEWINEFVHDSRARLPDIRVMRIGTHSGHSNDIAEATFSDGSTLLIKRARHEWAAASFAAAAEAARLISAGSDIVVPQPLPGLTAGDVQAYWRIDLPTLAQLWPGLSGNARAEALRSLGELMRRLHEITIPVWGPIGGSGRDATPGAAMERDLRDRLLPAVYAHWPRGAWSLERLIDAIPVVARMHERHTPRLVHADLHLGNVLCSVEDGDVKCVGLLDLDDVSGGAAEADIACFEMLHGPLFERQIDDDMIGEVRQGYDARRLESRLLDFYRCAHLANQGFCSGLLQHEEHAAAIAAEFERRVAALPSVGPANAVMRSWRLGSGSTSAHAAETRPLSRSG